MIRDCSKLNNSNCLFEKNEYALYLGSIEFKTKTFKFLIHLYSFLFYFKLCILFYYNERKIRSKYIE